MDWKYELSKLREKVALKIVAKLPSWIIYRSTIRLICHATTGEYENQVVPDLTAMDALQRWEK